MTQYTTKISDTNYTISTDPSSGSINVSCTYRGGFLTDVNVEFSKDKISVNVKREDQRPAKSTITRVGDAVKFEHKATFTDWMHDDREHNLSESKLYRNPTEFMEQRQTEYSAIKCAIEALNQLQASTPLNAQEQLIRDLNRDYLPKHIER